MRCCRPAPLQALPPVLYQLLLLSACGARAYALVGLCKLFDVLEALPEHQQQPAEVHTSSSVAAAGCNPLPSATLQQVQSTLLMHIMTLLRYDAQLGADWLQHFKENGVAACGHFGVQVWRRTV